MFRWDNQYRCFRGLTLSTLLVLVVSNFSSRTLAASSSLSSSVPSSLPLSPRNNFHKRNPLRLESAQHLKIRKKIRDNKLVSYLRLKSTSRSQYLSSSLASACSLRGGSSESDHFEDSDSEFDDSDFFSEESLDLDLDSVNFDAGDGDFDEDNTLTRAWDAFQKSPPLTKLYLSSSFAATAIGYFSNKNDFPSYLLLDWKATLTRLQIWRPFTAFLNFGPLNLGYLMTSHFVWTYMATLERLNHDTPYEFWWMMIFGGCTMIFGYTILHISPRFLGHNLSTFFVYVWSRYHEGLEVSLFDLFQTRAEILPWFFLAQTFLLEGEVPILDLLGIVFGHVYHYGRSVGIGKAPRFIREWYKNGEGELANIVRGEYKKIGSDFELQ